VRDGLCVRVCRKVFSRETEDSAPVVEHEGSCNSCGHCVLICPTGAITQAFCPPESIHQAQSHLMPSYSQVREMIVTRRSVRNFQDRPVTRETIERVIDSARFAPSAKNTQSTRFIVIQDKSLLRAIASLTAAWLGKAARRLRNPLWRKLYLLMGERDAEEITRWIGQFDLIAERAKEHRDLVLFGAPALLIFHAHRAVRFAETNAALAVENATFTASSLGLGSFFTGYVVSACSLNKKLPRLLELPKHHRVYGGLALGYPGIEYSRWIERNPAQTRWM
jgi:nitroreductase/NAD-dependent dihydropyrimidine dehydrogenase PreA subunit